MSKRVVAVGIILIILSSSLPLAFGYFETNIIDTSWTDSVIQFLNNAQPYPQWKDEYTLNAYTITLFENGTSTFVNATNGDSFSSYLLNVMTRADSQMSSVSDAFVNNVTQNDKVIYLRSRLGTNFAQAGTFVWDTYFVLEDNLYQGSLKGTIFVEHDSDNVRTWQHWAILLGQSSTPSPSPAPTSQPTANQNNSPTQNPIATPSISPTANPTPTPTVPECSWLAILSLFVSLLFCVVLVRFRNRINKNTK